MSKSKEDTTFIYALCDPDTNEVRYVGKSDNPVKRLKRHLGGHEPRPTHKSNWVKSLLRSGKEPLLKILEEIPRSAWQEAERKWMDCCSQNGANLTNTAEGGIGGKTVPFFSEEERAKRSERGKKRMAAIWAEIRAEHQAERDYIKEFQRKDNE